MIGYYLSSNNEICYSTKIQTFTPTKHTLTDHLFSQPLAADHWARIRDAKPSVLPGPATQSPKPTRRGETETVRTVRRGSGSLDQWSRGRGRRTGLWRGGEGASQLVWSQRVHPRGHEWRCGASVPSTSINPPCVLRLRIRLVLEDFNSKVKKISRRRESRTQQQQQPLPKQIANLLRYKFRGQRP